MHLATHSKRVHSANKDLQQSCLAVRGWRGQRDLRRAFGRLRRLSKPAYAEDIRAPCGASEGLHKGRSVLLRQRVLVYTNRRDTSCSRPSGGAGGKRGKRALCGAAPSTAVENLAKHLNPAASFSQTASRKPYGWGGAATQKLDGLQGVVVKPTPKTLEKEGAWERAILCTMADFGFRNCPIFLVEILGVENNEVEFSEVYCFQKNAPTILAASRRPFQLHPGAPEPPNAPSSNRACGVGLAPKKGACNRNGTPSCPLWEVPEIAANRRLSTLSTRNRALRLEEILEERARLEWGAQLEEIARAREEARRLRQPRNRANAGDSGGEEAAAGRKRRKSEETVLGILSERKTKKIRDVAGRRWKVLGHRASYIRPTGCFGRRRRQNRGCVFHKAVGKTARKHQRAVPFERRLVRSRDVLLLQARIKSSKSKCNQPNRSTTRTEYKSSGTR